MRRGFTIVALAAAVTAALSCQDRTSPVAPAGERAEARAAPLDAALSSGLELVLPTDPVEVLVTYDEGRTDGAALGDALLQLGAGVIGFRHLPVVAALATPVQIEAIRLLPGVDGIHANERLQYMNAEGIPSIRADEVHALGITGTGVGVAIVDTGIDGLYHPDVVFPGRTVSNVKVIADSRELYHDLDDLVGTDGLPRVGAELFVDDLANSETTSGHGTHVAGTAAGDGTASDGKYTGVAPGADLIGVGVGDVLVVLWALAGFDYVLDKQAEHNIRVVNNSWGSTGEFDPDHPISRATLKLYEAGITVVFSAGNCGSGGGATCPPAGQSQLNRHGLAPWTISVANGCKLVEGDPTDSAWFCEDDTGREPILARSSSRGLPGHPVHHPTITAPGSAIVSARSPTGAVMNVLDLPEDIGPCAIADEHLAFYTCAGGTSMAAPHVAGTVALMQQAAGRTLTPDEVKEILIDTARSLEDLGFELWEVGHGYLDAFAAVRAAERQGRRPPPNPRKPKKN